MTAALWISLAGIVITALVALSVAAMHRKQMRQIELHRADPSVPLIPPPHPWTRFLKTYGVLIFFFVWQIISLVRDLTQEGPVTRWQVFYIAVDITFAVEVLIIGLVVYLFDRIIRTLEVTIGVK